jgi:metallophosphoesterase (TIGR00282 family)
MRLLFIGDIVGPPGLAFVRKAVPQLRPAEALDLVIANAENATNGSGLLPRDYRHLRAAGIDAVTLGDHIYRRFDIAGVLSDPDEPVCKPANYPPAAPGRDRVLLTAGGVSVAVVSLLGRTYMKPVDCPFEAADRVLASLRGAARIVVVDVHAEATADKYLLARHLDGRVTAVLGTHTHVPTADEQILPGGTAFICDVGMTGPHDGVLGRRADRVLHTAVTFEPTTFDVAAGDVRLNGVIVDADPETGQATAIRRVVWTDDSPPTFRTAP